MRLTIEIDEVIARRFVGLLQLANPKDHDLAPVIEAVGDAISDALPQPIQVGDWVNWEGCKGDGDTYQVIAVYGDQAWLADSNDHTHSHPLDGLVHDRQGG